MGLQSVEEKGDRQKVGAAARAEVTRDEGSVHRRGSLAPHCLLDTALSEKPGRFLLGIAQAGAAAAVKQVSVLHGGQQGKETLDTSGPRVARREPAAEPQRGQPKLDCVRKAGGSLRPRAARAETAQRVCPMTA
jgi:hypothetical protein